MSIIYVLIPIAMLFVLVAVGIFFWAVRSDQFDDLEKQSVSILFEDDDDPTVKPSEAAPQSEPLPDQVEGKDKQGE